MKQAKTIAALITAVLLALTCSLAFAEELTAEPVATPTVEITAPAQPVVTVEPAGEATVAPAAEPTIEPTEEPAAEPTAEPTAEATVEPTEEPAAEPTAEPAEEAPAMETVIEIEERIVNSRIVGDEVVFYGTDVTLVGDLTGFEGLTYTLQWQRRDGDEWHDVEGETAASYTLTFTESVAGCAWRLVARVEIETLRPVETAEPAAQSEAPAQD